MRKNAGRAKFHLLNRYVGTEYVLSFFVAFAFFFFIFFINQILVLAQKIALKTVDVKMILELVVLSIPQFLMYTMPFSSLASASMVIGNFSSQNEILAMRSSGINTRKIFVPIVAISLFFSFGTLWIADYLIPASADRYKQMYTEVLTRIPTIELDPFSSTQFGKRVISNGALKDNVIYDVLVFDDNNVNDSRIISAKSATVKLIDLNRFIYRVDLQEPKILITDNDSKNSYSLANADQMTLYLTLESENQQFVSVSPSQMSLRELKNAADSKEDGSFYHQYYLSELYKKLALSFACTILVFVAFPISFFRIRYGRLVGFGISMLAACIYWFFLFFMHTQAIQITSDPFYYLWTPNIVFFSIGLLLLVWLRKN